MPYSTTTKETTVSTTEIRLAAALLETDPTAFADLRAAATAGDDESRNLLCEIATERIRIRSAAAARDREAALDHAMVDADFAPEA